MKKINTLKEYRAKILQNLGTMHDSAKIATIENTKLQHEKNEKSVKINQMALKSHQKLKADNLRKKAEAKKMADKKEFLRQVEIYRTQRLIKLSANKKPIIQPISTKKSPKQKEFTIKYEYPQTNAFNLKLNALNFKNQVEFSKFANLKGGHDSKRLQRGKIAMKKVRERKVI